MALQMQNAFSADVAEFSRFDRMQGVLARPKPVEHVITGGIARMNSCALIPVPAIYFGVVGHANSLICKCDICKSRASRSSRPRPHQMWPGAGDNALPELAVISLRQFG